MTTFLDIDWLDWLILWTSQFVHILTTYIDDVSKAKREKGVLSIPMWWADNMNKIKVITGILMSFIMLLVANRIDEPLVHKYFSAVAAVCGYMSSSLFNKVVSIVMNRVNTVK